MFKCCRLENVFIVLPNAEWQRDLILTSTNYKGKKNQKVMSARIKVNQNKKYFYWLQNINNVWYSLIHLLY